MNSYIALMRKNVDTDYSVNFPDLPGCTTAGVTIHEAYAFAHEALALHLEDTWESGDVVPPPSTLRSIMVDPDNRDAVAILVAADLHLVGHAI